MNFRTAAKADIPQLQQIRNAVRENVLSNPDLVSYQDYEDYLDQKGKGWLCEIGNNIVGFSIVDLSTNNVWALFVDPKFEKTGIGKKLHQLMLDWYFVQTDKEIWLGTAPNTRAAKFYEMQGWQQNGSNGEKEIKFVMTKKIWLPNAD